MTTDRNRTTKDDDGRRTQLVAAATRVISQGGVAAASTRRVASEAGVPPGLVHYWFSGKDELLTEVVASLLREVEQSAVATDPQATGESPEETIRAQFRRAFDNVVRSDDRGRQIAIYELTTWALRSEAHAELAQRQYSAYRETATRLIGPVTDQLSTPVADAPDALAQLVSALFDGVTLAWLADPDGTDPDAIFDLFSRLLAAAPPAP
ncbi:conserved hypothetical protein [Aeromicrobium sp. 9AM]|jgi:AcrR family transcriptional regulator|nr:TetR family transcriptional regulator [Aeromicrobium sp. 9AM]VXB72642.1 conserved hypothetical protein [Aeromicrobium sp. 9AM]